MSYELLSYAPYKNVGSPLPKKKAFILLVPRLKGRCNRRGTVYESRVRVVCVTRVRGELRSEYSSRDVRNVT